MDAVISVDTGLAHLAGLMGVPTIVILPKASDWRWLRADPGDEWFDRSFWYRSVVLVRRGDGGWEEVRETIRQRMEGRFWEGE